jgi:ATP-dependent Clp protease ATP-binding subunit ClpB
LNNIKDLKKRLAEAKHQLEVAQREGQYELASRLRFATIPELEDQLPSDIESEAMEESPMVMLHDRVTSNDISRVVARATGIPVQNLLKGERDKLVHVCFSFLQFFFLSLSHAHTDDNRYSWGFFRWKMLYVDV